MTTNESAMEAPFVADEIDEMKDVEFNDMVPSDANDPQEMMKDLSKKDEVKEMVTTTDIADDEEKVDKVGRSSDDKIPSIGMAFRTYEEASNFYKQYALRVGFGVAVKKSSFSKSGVCRRLILGCSKGGRGRADACYLARQTAKTNCEAMIAVKLWGDGLLHVVDAKLEHNHPVKECSYIENGKRTESKDHEVFYNAEELAVQCICGFFQFHGILCRHSLSVFKLQQIFEIPSHYILNRWKKDFKRLHTLANYADDIVPDSLVDRHDYLSMRFLQLVEVGFLSEDRYQLALKLIRELEKFLLDEPGCRDRQSRLLSFETQPGHCVQDLLASRFVISDCNKSQSSLQTKRRGRPQKKLEESNIEALVRANKEQDFLRSSLIQNENPVLQAASTSLHQDAHIGSQGGIDLMEEVNQNDLSFGTHFGIHVNQDQIVGQVRMQPSNLFQVQYEQQALGTPTRMPWLYHQLYQDYDYCYKCRRIKFRKHLLAKGMDRREGIFLLSTSAVANNVANVLVAYPGMSSKH
ncbi:hypothetical protein M5K25_002116 [Dendrobium thyrsiflorum]|uniref:Protein FAR1-RELATED SEQUENCE n=1 Tax=Dendrobium thyrsiflorum TaxID=117978 RepID=A0ABD0VRT3_DENTH